MSCVYGDLIYGPPYFPSQATIWDLLSLILMSFKACITKLSHFSTTLYLGFLKNPRIFSSNTVPACVGFFQSSTILSVVFWNASCKTFDLFFEMVTSLDNFSFFTEKSNLEVMSTHFWLISLFCSGRSCCCTRIFFCNVKNDEMMFALMIFSSCPLVRIFDLTIN